MADRQRSKSPSAEPLGGPAGTSALPDAGTADPADRGELLATVESEIITRLMLLHGDGREQGRSDKPPLSSQDLFELARLAVSHDVDATLTFAQALHGRGLSHVDILHELVAPTASLLEVQWLAELRSFDEVCAGLSTLRQLVYRLGPGLPDMRA